MPGQLALFDDLGASASRSTAAVSGLGAAAAVASRNTATLGAQFGTARAAAAGLGSSSLVAAASFTGIGAAALIAAKGFTSAVRLAADLQTELNTFQIVAGATADEMSRVREESRALGADITLPAVSAGDAAQAMTELSKAGLSVEDALAGARGVLQLSTAAQLGTADSAKIAASALNAFGLAGDQASHVADLLSGASLAAQGEVSDMAQALQQSAAVAHQVGLSIEDTAGAITVLAKNGIIGSDAGTSLRTTLLRLVPTTKEAQQFVTALGVSFQDATGNLLPLSEIFENYRVALARLTPVQQQATLTQIFGTDAIRAASIFAREGAAGIEAITAETNRAGAANLIASARTSGFAGQLSALQSNLETLGSTIGTAFLPPLTELIGALNEGVSVIGEFGSAISFLDKITIDPWEGFVLGANAADAAIDFFSNDAVKAGESVQEISRQIVELRQQADSFGRGKFGGAGTFVDPDAARQIEFLSNVLQSRLSPALRNSAIDAQGLQTSLADAASRANLPASTEILQSGMADAGERAGLKFVQGVGDGITTGETAAVASARRALANVIREGDLAITQAVEDAKSNLAAIGSTLSAQVGEIIDAGPLGRQIAALEASLGAGRATAQRLGLVADLNEAKIAMREARIDAGPLGDRLRALQAQLSAAQNTGQRSGLASALRDAQEALQGALRAANTGNLTVSSTQAASIAEFLRPFRESVTDAKREIRVANLQGEVESTTNAIAAQKEKLRGDPFVALRQGIKDVQTALKTFDTEAVIAGLRKQAAAEKTVVERGIADIIAQFNTGGITMAQANGRIARLIGSKVGPWQTAGRSLGTAFNLEFISTVEGLQEQLEAIVLGPQRPGTTGARARIDRPQETVLAEATRRQDARDAVQKAIADGINDPGSGTNALLQQIRDALKGAPTPKTRTPVGGP